MTDSIQNPVASQPFVISDAAPAATTVAAPASPITEDVLKVSGIANMDDLKTIVAKEVDKLYHNLFSTSEGISSLEKSAKQYYNAVNAPFNMFAEAENMLNQDTETSLEEKEIILQKIKENYKEIADDVSLSDIKRKELLTKLSKKSLDTYKVSKKESLFNESRNYHELVGRLSEDHSPVMAQSLIAASRALLGNIFNEVPELVDEMCKYMPPSIMKRVYDNLHNKHFAMDIDSMRMKYEHDENAKIMGEIMAKKLRPRR
jgi:hypothetical protein